MGLDLHIQDAGEYVLIIYPKLPGDNATTTEHLAAELMTSLTQSRALIAEVERLRESDALKQIALDNSAQTIHDLAVRLQQYEPQTTPPPMTIPGQQPTTPTTPEVPEVDELPEIETGPEAPTQPMPPIIEPPTVPEPTTPPVITIPDNPPAPDTPLDNDPVFPFCGLYFEDERAVDGLNQARQRAAALQPAMEFAANSAIRDYIVFNNPIDLQVGILPKVMERLKKRYWHSPLINMYVQEPKVFTNLLKALHDAGVYGLIFDDAQNTKPDEMNRVLELIDQVLPGIPIIASFTSLSSDADYPSYRYKRARQWYPKPGQDEPTLFKDYFARFPGEIYTGDMWHRPNGYIHSPERVRAAYYEAMKYMLGTSWYTFINPDTHTNIMQMHNEAKAKDINALTHWDVIRECAADYMAHPRWNKAK